MFNNVKPFFPGFRGQQGIVKEDPTSVSTQPANIVQTSNESSQINAKVKEQSSQSKKPTKSTVSVLQQKFGASKDISYVPNNGRIFFESINGHFYPMPSKNIALNQRKTISSVSFTSQGLMNIRKRYEEIHGATTFLHAFLKMENFSEKLHDMVKNPALYRYFEEEKFLVMSNMSYDPAGDRYTSPKSQKLKDQGVTLCAWFIHPNLSSINDDTRTLLRELSEGSSSPKPLIEKLRTQCESTAFDTSKEIERDEKTIGQLKQNGEYLATILDLNASHIPLLTSLKEKTMHQLAEIYGVNKTDQVALYFHFPYEEDTTTLHLHIRVNHGLHPFEQGRSFTLDEIVSGLSDGKTIDEIILERQNESNGRFLRVMPDHEKIFQDIEGITIAHNNLNMYRLEPAKSGMKAIDSRDDLYHSKK